MRIFVAGASGAIGQPLIAELIRRGHEVTGMTRSESGARTVAALGAAVAQVSAFDGAAVDQALRDARAESQHVESRDRPTNGASGCRGRRIGSR